MYQLALILRGAFFQNGEVVFFNRPCLKLRSKRFYRSWRFGQQQHSTHRPIEAMGQAYDELFFPGEIFSKILGHFALHAGVSVAVFVGLQAGWLVNCKEIVVFEKNW